MKAYAEGNSSLEDIAQLYGIRTQSSVKNWYDIYQSQGEKGLINMNAQGRPTKKSSAKNSKNITKFAQKAKAAGKSIGLRINPECSTQDGHAIYDPCAPGSRLGTTRAVWNREMTGEWISLLDGLHFHTLCEQNSDDLKTTLDAVEEKFGKYMHCLLYTSPSPRD